MASQEERQIEANTLRQQAETIRVLVQDVGFDKRVVVAAVCGGDLYRLLVDEWGYTDEDRIGMSDGQYICRYCSLDEDDNIIGPTVHGVDGKCTNCGCVLNPGDKLD